MELKQKEVSERDAFVRCKQSDLLRMILSTDQKREQEKSLEEVGDGYVHSKVRK